MSQLTANPSAVQAAQPSGGLDLAIAAAARERTNRSRVPIVLAMILLAACVIYALTGAMARSEAGGRVDAQARNTESLRALAERFRTAMLGQADARFAADPLMGSKLERLAEGVGLKLSGPVSFVELPSVAGPAGMVQRKFTAKASNADPAVLLKFLESSQNKLEFPGLDVANIVLRPAGRAGGVDATHDGGWELTVDFTRWERRGG